MVDTLASVLLLIGVIPTTLILITALDWAFTLKLFRPSRQDVRKLLISLEDLLLPMGSFSSDLLHPWALEELSRETNHTTLPLLMTPATECARSELDCQSPTPKPTHDDGGVKLLVEPSATSTLLDGESNSTTIPSLTLPTPNVDHLEPSAELPSFAQAATNHGSSPEEAFALRFSPPDDHGSVLSAMSRWTKRQTGNLELNAADLHSSTYPTISRDRPLVSENPSDQASSDSPRTQQSPAETSCNAGSAVDVPLPEQTAAEIDALGKSFDPTSEEVQKDQKQEEDSPAAAKAVSTESKAPEQQDENSTAAVEEVPTESQAFEVAIRGLIDPNGISGSNLGDLAALVADVLKGKAEAEEKLRSEIIRFSREEEDLRHDWIDQRGYIERVINGQNDFVDEKGVESNRLFVENSRLDRENSGFKEQLRDQEEQYKRDVEILEAEKQYAENAETTALAGVERRIGEEKLRYERESLAAEDRHSQAMNSEKCQRYEVSKELARTQDCLSVVEKNYEAALEKKNKAIDILKTDLGRVEPAVAAAVERETSTKERLEKQLKDQRQEKDHEIDSLKNKLREARKKARSVDESLSRWRLSAQTKEVENQRLSARLDEEIKTLREDRDHIVGGLKLDKTGLERSLRDDEAVINDLKKKITEFESGDELRGLQSQLQNLKKKHRMSAKEAHNLTKKLQSCQQETEEYQRKVKAQESRRSEEVKKASDEKRTLENQLADLKDELAEAVRVSKEGQTRTAKEFKEQKEKLSREIKDAKSREKKMRADIQRVRDEKGQIATQHQTTINAKDEEIMRLQAVQLGDERRQSATEYEKVVMEKDEEIRRLQKAVQIAKDGEIAKHREFEEEHAKVAAEKAAKDAADKEKMTLQHQLDDERQASRDMQDKATETETKLRNEIIALKSEVSKAEETQSHSLVSNQTSKEAQEVAVLLGQANDANELLWEIAKTGVVQGSPEHSTLCELNDAKFALHKVKYELQKPNFAASRPRLVSIIAGVNVNEECIRQFTLDTPQLVGQVRKANARLGRLQKILDTNADVQKDAMLEALHTEIPNERVIRTPRALKRPVKLGSGTLPQNSSTGVRAGNAQPHPQAAIPPAQNQGNAQAQSGNPTNGPNFPSKPMPKRDHREPFENLLASVSSTPVIQIHAAPRQEPTAEEDSLRPVSPQRPIRSIRGRRPQLAHSPSADRLSMPQMPVGWTAGMTETVRLICDETIYNIEMNVRAEYDFVPQDDKVLEEWLKKLQSDFRAEKRGTKL